jgi:hypothetical protein
MTLLKKVAAMTLFDVDCYFKKIFPSAFLYAVAGFKVLFALSYLKWFPPSTGLDMHN